LIRSGIKQVLNESYINEASYMGEKDKLARFEELALPHLGAAYNLARWLLRHDHDAEDVVQEAYLRAYKFFAGFRGDDARAWLLVIVRNACYTWLEQNRTHGGTVPFDDGMNESSFECPDSAALSDASVNSPEAELVRQVDTQLLRRALETLPAEFREVIVLRELEGLSYKQISTIAQIPAGTVMSRLARGRKLLQKLLAQHLKEGLR
jgi:RNA polymerase sigma-70 factor (ECF subfamily)